ncbi:transposase [Candidatus Acidianus copahuensis]|uniref:Transposase n=1 Tax=Candidatus Acidianus copahuensis TaxID=1160895 RepID=A0A031LUP4_9CREN|nr:IS607 family transposase [Candidatus Acidianus copahuensis]EZQ11536.1 transposase [Candidatus Acidianus copahuensis]
MLKPKEVCERLGISYRTLQRYIDQGLIQPIRLPKGQMRFREEDVERLVGMIRKREVILYARVSSETQKDDLKNQIEALKKKTEELGVREYIILTDVDSGLNMKRKNFMKLLKMILNNEVSKVVIMYKDRLVRFGNEIIEEVCKTHGCELLVLEDEDKTPEQELIEDLISIMVSFSGKLYGMRSHKYEKVKKCADEIANS